MKTTRVALLLLVGLTACTMPTYYPPTDEPPGITWESPATYDETWEAVIAYFAEGNLSIETIEKASGIVVAGVRVVSYDPEELAQYADFGSFAAGKNKTRPAVQYLDLKDHRDIWVGSGFQGGSAQGRYNVFVRTDSDGESAVVRANVAWTGSLFWKETPVVLTAVSTGMLEERILTAIAARMGVESPELKREP